MTPIEALFILLCLLLAAVVALRAWMADDARVRAEVDALADVPQHLKADILDCLEAAASADRQTWPYDLSAPIVMLLVLPFVKREADRLPKAFSKWDNNVSLNGDGEGWCDDDGTWYDTRVRPAPEGVPVLSHSDPLYGGRCYYARGHHPRSFWARYVWVGLRNRASQLSKDLGEPVTERPVCISGNPDIHRNGPYGHFLLKSGNCYHYKSINRWHGLALIRSYGYKLEIVRNSQDGTGLAAAVAIGRSLKRRKS